MCLKWINTSVLDLSSPPGWMSVLSCTAHLLQTSDHKVLEANLANVFRLLSFFSALAACCFLSCVTQTCFPPPGATAVTRLTRKPVNICWSGLTPFNTGPRGSLPHAPSRRHRLLSDFPLVQSQRNIEEHVRQQRRKDGSRDLKGQVFIGLNNKRDHSTSFCFQIRPSWVSAIITVRKVTM